jgi:hypothetical protein
MRQIKDAFDVAVTGFVAEDNPGPTDKNGKRSAIELLSLNFRS